MKCDGQFDVFLNGQAGQQGSALEQYSPIFMGAGLLVPDPLAQDFDRSCIGPVQAKYAAHQHGFAGPRAADDAQDFIPADFQIQLVMYRLCAETVNQSAD